MLPSGPRGSEPRTKDVAEFRERIETRSRNEQWRKTPRRIELAECIGCDSCLRTCPAQFNAVYNQGLDVVIVPEMCNGCGKCVLACPVDCIYPDPNYEPTSPSLWDYVKSQEMTRVRD